jgi:hypothetical protein
MAVRPEAFSMSESQEKSAIIRHQSGGRKLGQWTGLLALSGVLSLALHAVHLPAALLLGPMVAGIIVAASGWILHLPSRPFTLAQALIGCMIAGNIPGSSLAEMAGSWHLFAIVIVTVIAASSGLGWLLTRWRVLPDTTAVWGTSPGAAGAMVLMAGEYGADMRLVAFMQYLRVVCVVAAASLVARIWVFGAGGPPAEAEAVIWFPAMDWGAVAATLAIALGGIAAARVLRVPSGSLLLPMAAGVALQSAGIVTIALPPWLLAACYAYVGWAIGLRFTRPILLHAARALPRVFASILALMSVGGLLAVMLVVVAGVDPLTAYLATSPGGLDSVAIIAAGSPVDRPFVMAMQSGRILVVILTCPLLARWVAGRMEDGESPDHAPE